MRPLYFFGRVLAEAVLILLAVVAAGCVLAGSIKSFLTGAALLVLWGLGRHILDRTY